MTSSSENFSLLSWNLSLHTPRFGQGDISIIKQIYSGILDTSADVVCLQGVFWPQARSLIVRHLRKRLPYWISEVGESSMFSSDNGLMIFSRYAIKKNTFKKFKKGLFHENFIQKGLLLAAIQLPCESGNRWLHIATTSLESPIGNFMVEKIEQTENKLQQLQTSSKWIEEWLEPFQPVGSNIVFFAGFLDIEPNSREYIDLTTDIFRNCVDLVDQLGVGTMYCPEEQKYKRLDYLFQLERGNLNTPSFSSQISTVGLSPNINHLALVGIFTRLNLKIQSNSCKEVVVDKVEIEPPKKSTELESIETVEITPSNDTPIPPEKLTISDSDTDEDDLISTVSWNFVEHETVDSQESEEGFVLL